MQGICMTWHSVSFSIHDVSKAFTFSELGDIMPIDNRERAHDKCECGGMKLR